MCVHANGISQTVSISGKNISLKSVFAAIKQQTDYVVFYTDKHILKNATTVTLNSNNVDIKELLDEALKNQPIDYTIINKTISIFKKEIKQAGFVENTVAVTQKGITIKGKVVNENNEPVIATVLVKGSGKGVSTNENGEFELYNIDENAILIVSGIGIETFETSVNGRTNFLLRAKAKTATSEAVVITGYGSYSKRDYTGAATVIKTNTLKDVPTVSIADRLAGTTPGMQITFGSGQPGAAESIRIRGLGSINAGNDPLIVVDGVPVINGNISKVGVSAAGTSVLSTINPGDIESLTVIKDAAAASLYGSRAANGVIVITTKSGKEGKTNISIKSDIGFSDMAVNYRPLLSGDERAKVLELGIANYAADNGYDINNPAIQQLFAYTAKPWSGWTDWRKELSRTGTRQNHEFSISGGNKQTKIYSSIAYTNQKGISRWSDYKRFSGRVNVTHKAGIFELQANILLTNINQNIDFEGGTTSPFAASSFYVSPADYPYNEDGSFNTTKGFTGVYGSMNNPKLIATYNYNQNNSFRTLNNIAGTVDILPGLKLKQQFSYDYINAAGKTWLDPRTGPGASTNGKYTRVTDGYTKYVWQTQAYYDKTFSANHHLNVFAGYEGENYKNNSETVTGEDYANPQLPEIINAARSTGSSVLSETSLLSYLSRINYNYNHLYYASASFRRDGSSRLSPESRWGNFWSVSGAWRVGSENFWQNSSLGKIFTDAKLKSSYGVNGTLPTDWYGFDGVFKLGNNYNGSPGSAESTIPNPSLSWERNLALNVGVEFTIANKYNFSVDYYNRNTKDLLMLQPISLITGFTNYWRNIGAMNNRGVEIEFNTTLVNTKTTRWFVSVNSSYNKNKLTQLADGQSEIIAYPFIRKVGFAYNTYHAFERAGIDAETGKQLYYKNTPVKDDNGNITGYDRTTVSSHTQAQKVPVGQMEPKWIGGISNSFQWNNISLNFLISYSLGGHIYDHYGVYQADGADYAYTGGLASFYDIDKIWKQPGDDAVLPRFTYSRTYPQSDRWLLSTNHIRLKNITLGYSIPEEWGKKLYITNARIYASAANLFTLKSKDLYVDPESVANGGLLTGETPPLRTVTFGIEINF